MNILYSKSLNYGSDCMFKVAVLLEDEGTTLSSLLKDPAGFLQFALYLAPSIFRIRIRTKRERSSEAAIVGAILENDFPYLTSFPVPLVPLPQCLILGLGFQGNVQLVFTTHHFACCPKSDQLELTQGC
ncbi:hypothetical protein ILYODFUR_026007 [Ilyodon furcidens]|uniref:Uncharacterized protein n=1 Tax=Ilyodon furcidens TaxID=33524 RepID=A0ABV0SPB0_9TELE